MYISVKERQLLKKVFEAYSTHMYELRPSQEQLAGITFSDEFKHKMEKLISRRKKPYYYLINTASKRAACIIAALLIVLSGVTFGVEAIREPVIKFIVEAYEKFSTVLFESNDKDEAITEYHLPAYVPEGYKIVSEEKTAHYYMVKYKNDAGYVIHFTQRLPKTKAYIDTEDIYTEYIGNGIYADKNSEIRKYYITGKSRYVYKVDIYDNNMSKDEIIKVIESINAEK